MILSHDTTVFTTDPRVEVHYAILYFWVNLIQLIVLGNTTFFLADCWIVQVYFYFSFVQVHFYPVSGIWELRISRLGEQDAGEYGCQVCEKILPKVTSALAL